MEPLATSRKLFIRIYLCPADENEDKSKIIQYRYSLLTIFAFLSSGIAFTIASLVKYWSIDLTKALYSPIQFGPTSSTVYSIIIAFVLRNKILDMFHNLSKIYKKCKWIFLLVFCDTVLKTNCLFFLHFKLIDENDFNISFLTEANDKIEWVWRIYLKLVFEIIPSNMCMLTAVTVSLCYVQFGHFVVKYAYHPYLLM